jgi:hypothetical protein
VQEDIEKEHELPLDGEECGGGDEAAVNATMSRSKSDQVESRRATAVMRLV